MTRLHFLSIAVLLALLVTACAQQVIQREPGPAAARKPEISLRKPYEETVAQGRSVYRVDAAQSAVAITVRRAGSLARLGHDHVVASHAVQGWIAPDAGRADLLVPLAELAVDEPPLRGEAALDTQPSASDIAGTRANMLDKVLETQKFPYALVHIDRAAGTSSDLRLNVAITLHGVTRTFVVPAVMETGRDTMEVSGSFEFNQSDFGIVPFSILGGAVQVQDQLSLRFRIRSHRILRPGDLAD